MIRRLLKAGRRCAEGTCPDAARLIPAEGERARSVSAAGVWEESSGSRKARMLGGQGERWAAVMVRSRNTPSPFNLRIRFHCIASPPMPPLYLLACVCVMQEGNQYFTWQILTSTAWGGVCWDALGVKRGSLCRPLMAPLPPSSPPSSPPAQSTIMSVLYR